MRYFVFICVLLCSLSAVAAKPTGLGRPDIPSELFVLKNPVEQAQELLGELGFYDGPADGRESSELAKAIRAYQRKYGLSVSGEVDHLLLNHLENIGKVQVLIKRLDHLRKTRQEQARAALLANPETRKLVEEKKDVVADPTRDSSQCFLTPTPHCLLKEAVASSHAVFEDDLRDWALGEILTAQVSSGMRNEAMTTAGRIKDSRLVVAALTNIARTLAMQGNIEGALSGLGLIPLIERRLSVLLDIARFYEQEKRDNDLQQTLDQIVTGAQTVDVPEIRLSVMIEAAKLTGAHDAAKALGLLETYQVDAERNLYGASQATTLRHIATVMAEIGYPEWAQKTLDKLPDDEMRIPVLMAAARSFMKQGRFEAVSHSIERISAPRYRSIIMSDFSSALYQAGSNEKARDALAKAETLARSIDLPFAKNFALSAVARVYMEMVTQEGQKEDVAKARALSALITDDRMRARVVWDLSQLDQDVSLPGLTKDLENSADIAVNAVGSDFSRAWMLGDIATEFQKKGEKGRAREVFQQGLDAVQAITNPWARSRALAKFGSVLYQLD